MDFSDLAPNFLLKVSPQNNYFYQINIQDGHKKSPKKYP